MSDENSDNSRGLVKFNTWWLAAAILVLAVVAALVLVLVFGERNTPEDGSSPSSAPSTPSSQSTDDESQPPSEGGTCDLPVETDIPTVGPDAEWVNSNFLLVPRSSTFGPVDREGALWGCFAHSPTGALFAAANVLGGLISAQDSAEFAAFVEAAAVNNDGRALWIEDNGSEVNPPSAGAAVPQISGFRFDSVEPDKVVVRIGATQGSGERVFNGYWAMTLLWDESASTWLVDVERFDLFPVVDDLKTFTDWNAAQQ
jgi:hypothetical protein